MEKTVNKKKYMYYLVILIAVLILGTVTATYAFFQATTDSTSIAKTTIVGKTDCIDIKFSTDKSRVGLNLDYPVTDTYALEHIKPLEISIENKCSNEQEPIDYTLVLSTFAKSNVEEGQHKYINDNQIRTNIKSATPYTTDDSYSDLQTTTYLDELLRVSSDSGYNEKLLTDHFKDLSDNHPEGFTDFNSNDFDIVTNYVIDTNNIATGSTNKYKIYLWIDYYEGDKNAYKEGSTHDEKYDNTTENHDFESLVSLIVNNKEEGVEPPGPTLADTIKGKYQSDDTVLGSQDTGNDGYLIYHDGTGTYGTYEAGDKSYRFSGNNPDNYVCLDGNTGTDTCDKTKLYRVIGIFPKEENATEYTTKLIKSEYITADELGGNLVNKALTKYTGASDYTPRADLTNAVGFYWSGDSSINYNNWIKSTLNTTLNGESGNYLTSLSAYTDLIEDTKWYIGGNKNDNITYQNSMKDAYENELGANKLNESSSDCVDESGNTTQCTDDLLYEESKKVGLMYATEYGYASAPSNWSSHLYNYNNANNRGENWLYNGVNEWTISRQAGVLTYIAFGVTLSGFVNNRSRVYNDSYGVRPVLVLKSNATVKSGEGSKEKPWRINLQSS